MTTPPEAPPLTLVEFLRARLDEDEMTAMAAGDSHRWYVWVAPDKGYPQRVMETGTLALLCETYDGPVDNTGLRWSPVTANHIARQDPARVLADVAAKRAIITAFEQRDEPEHPIINAHATGLLIAVRHLATVYAAHPDYREEWKP